MITINILQNGNQPLFISTKNSGVIFCQQQSPNNFPKLLLLFFMLFYSAGFAQYQNSFFKLGAITPARQYMGEKKLVKPAGTGPNTNIRSSLQDRAGNLWFATTGAGIYRSDAKYLNVVQPRFTNYTTLEGLNNNIVYCLMEDNRGNIWMGTKDGICIYDARSIPGGKPAITRFQIPGIDPAYNIFNAGLFSIQDRSLKDNSVTSIIQDNSGNIWFGTTEMGLYCYNPVTRQFNNYKRTGGEWKLVRSDSIRHNRSFQQNNIQSLLQDSKGNIWFSSAGNGSGVYRFNGGCKKYFANENSMQKTLAGLFTHFPLGAWLKCHVNWIKEDNGGNVWFGTRDAGICRYDGKSLPGDLSAFTWFTAKNGLPENFSFGMLVDNRGGLWFSSTLKMEGGRREGCLLRYDGKTFTPFPMINMPNTSIWSMLQDKQGNIWFGSGNAGLYRYDGKTFINYTEEGC